MKEKGKTKIKKLLANKSNSQSICKEEARQLSRRNVKLYKRRIKVSPHLGQNISARITLAACVINPNTPVSIQQMADTNNFIRKMVITRNTVLNKSNSLQGIREANDIPKPLELISSNFLLDFKLFLSKLLRNIS
ncbi:hypothetical protein QL285_025423 [Trifolium repens]|nr:hypothetical protein QL285_025423 [Trifolium repens]